MNAMRLLVLVALIAIFSPGGAVSAATQPVPAQKPPAAQIPEGPRPPSPGEVQSIVDGWVIVQAQTALDLTDAQFAQFVIRFRAVQEARRRNQRARVQLIQELGRLTNPKNAPADEALLREKLKALDDLEGRSVAELRKAYDSVDEVLDVRQQARLRVFLEQVERRMLEILTKARAQAAAGAQAPGRGR